MPGNNYKQIVFLSGKGGTGKTTITFALSSLIINKILIDCDVDAANLYLLVDPVSQNEFPFSGGKKANIQKEKCSECSLCETLCRFQAIKNFTVDHINCEGCGFCAKACPEKAILFEKNLSGSYFECKLEDNTKFLYARLLPGEGNSGKLVTGIKTKATESIDESVKYILVDGPPGIGCPVNASIAETDFVVIVTEPSLSGVHDLKRLIQLLLRFNLKFGVVINKYDVNYNMTCEIVDYLKNKEIPLLGKFPFDKRIAESIRVKNPITEIDSNYKLVSEGILEMINSNLSNNTN